eukprot:TRINITY_DN12967_c0_g2_i1.p1 TRINITY_DN12967_c0_g2~~TRINITY_DN12967_c0_g2_i1.p1  ORF type:complete len:299 (+),score=86.38 TRINITY_DN12967_c0_g2_i1:94-897(+)
MSKRAAPAPAAAAAEADAQQPAGEALRAPAAPHAVVLSRGYGKQLFCCSHCGTSFTRADTLEAHISEQHLAVSGAHRGGSPPRRRRRLDRVERGVDLTDDELRFKKERDEAFAYAKETTERAYGDAFLAARHVKHPEKLVVQFGDGGRWRPPRPLLDELLDAGARLGHLAVLIVEHTDKGFCSAEVWCAGEMVAQDMGRIADGRDRGGPGGRENRDACSRAVANAQAVAELRDANLRREMREAAARDKASSVEVVDLAEDSESAASA